MSKLAYVSNIFGRILPNTQQVNRAFNSLLKVTLTNNLAFGKTKIIVGDK